MDEGPDAPSGLEMEYEILLPFIHTEVRRRENEEPYTTSGQAMEYKMMLPIITYR